MIEYSTHFEKELEIEIEKESGDISPADYFPNEAEYSI